MSQMILRTEHYNQACWVASQLAYTVNIARGKR